MTRSASWSWPVQLWSEAEEALVRDTSLTLGQVAERTGRSVPAARLDGSRGLRLSAGGDRPASAGQQPLTAIRRRLRLDSGQARRRTVES
jgi:hypothetical protein